MGNVTKKIYTEISGNEKENNTKNENYLLEIELEEQKKMNEQLMEELFNKNNSYNNEIKKLKFDNTTLKYKINILKDKLKMFGENVDNI